MTSARRRGSGLLELALGLPVLVLLLVGMGQTAYTILVFQQLSDAVRSGARYAANAPFDADPKAYAQRVRNAVVYGTPAGGAAIEAQAPGLKPEHVDVNWTPGRTGAPEQITITLRGYSVPWLFRTVTLHGRPRATVTYAGE
jgi:Flp pilus assembly protein TadG